MMIALHKNARTTPAVRAEMAVSNETARVLAQRFGFPAIYMGRYRAARKQACRSFGVFAPRPASPVGIPPV